MQPPVFFTYILTNKNKSLLYVGVTNNLAMRLTEHWIGKEGSFTTKYNIRYLVWYERSRYLLNAIDSEKKIKKYTRAQKEALINQLNPEWKFLNEEVAGHWPPTDEQVSLAIETRLKNSDKLM